MIYAIKSSMNIPMNFLRVGPMTIAMPIPMTVLSTVSRKPYPHGGKPSQLMTSPSLDIQLKPLCHFFSPIDTEIQFESKFLF
jgi:hypothetical protein